MSSRSVSLSIRTRTGFSYPHLDTFRRITEKQRCDSINESNFNRRKCYRRESVPSDKIDHFDSLPDDIIILILCKLSSSVDPPAELLNVLSTSKRLNGLGLNSLVQSKASRKMFAIKASNLSDSAHRFLKLAAESGNVGASYTLEMGLSISRHQLQMDASPTYISIPIAGPRFNLRHSKQSSYELCIAGAGCSLEESENNYHIINLIW